MVPPNGSLQNPDLKVGVNERHVVAAKAALRNLGVLGVSCGFFPIILAESNKRISKAAERMKNLLKKRRN